jgi:aryl-alcohol dehydrogenase (NADP+)
LSKPVVSAPIVGVTRSAQLADLVGALSVELSAEEVSSLEEPYEPHPVAGH